MPDLKAVVFVPALAGSVIFAFVFLLFAANYYLTIVESSSVGAKEVTWHSEPIFDNASKLAYMAWLVGLWLGPAYLFGRYVTSGIDSAWIKLAIPVAVFWICFPISQLSSMSATTIWLPLIPDAFVRLAQKPLVYLGFLAFTFPVLAIFAVGFKWAFLTAGEFPRLFAGTPLLVAAGFLYARMIGRLAFGLRYTKSLFRERERIEEQNEKKEKAQARKRRPKEKYQPIVRQASELPPINTPLDGELSGYNFKMDEEPAAKTKKRIKAEAVEVEEGSPGITPVERESMSFEEETPRTLPVRGTSHPVDEDFSAPRRRRSVPSHSRSVEASRIWTEEDEDASGYGVREVEVNVAENTPKVLMEASAEEMRLLDRSDLPRRSANVWGVEIFAFLSQPGTISAFAIATGLCFVAGVFVRIARAFNPVPGGVES